MRVTQVDISPFAASGPTCHRSAGLGQRLAQGCGQAHGAQMAVTAQTPGGAFAGNGEAEKVLHLGGKLAGMDRVQRLGHGPVIDLVQGFERRRFRGRVGVVVNARRLDAPGFLGQLHGFNGALETIKRPGPQVGVNVFVGDGGVHLQVAFFDDAQRANGRE